MYDTTHSKPKVTVQPVVRSNRFFVTVKSKSHFKATIHLVRLLTTEMVFAAGVPSDTFISSVTVELSGRVVHHMRRAYETAAPLESFKVGGHLQYFTRRSALLK